MNIPSFNKNGFGVWRNDSLSFVKHLIQWLQALIFNFSLIVHLLKIISTSQIVLLFWVINQQINQFEIQLAIVNES